MQPSLLSQGLELMLAGMGTVFVFLTLLVFATKLMSWFATRYLPDAIPAVAAPGQPDTRPTSEEIAAIAAAIAVHKNKK